MISLVTLLAFAFRAYKIRDSSWLLICSFLLEHSLNVSSRLGRSQSFNSFFICFLFIGIVISNGYKGIVTTGITEPLLPRQIVLFDDVLANNYSLIPPAFSTHIFYIKCMVGGRFDFDREHISSHNYTRDDLKRNPFLIFDISDGSQKLGGDSRPPCYSLLDLTRTSDFLKRLIVYIVHILEPNSFRRSTLGSGAIGTTGAWYSEDGKDRLDLNYTSRGYRGKGKKLAKWLGIAVSARLPEPSQ
jgi:hypothetical protein